MQKAKTKLFELLKMAPTLLLIFLLCPYMHRKNQTSSSSWAMTSVIWNIGAYSRGMMAGRTPNLDKLAKGGMLFTDYYAEASCTAGRANFITGELPIRTGMTTVGQAGAKIGMPDAAPTIATVLKTMGYATGQFGKNHLGDLNQFLPTVHGFDEFLRLSISS